MAKRLYLLLFFCGVALGGVLALFQPVTGHMDSDYYYAMGLQIVNGRGGEQPFIWNYLADPQGVPMPSFAYWMPLPSFLAAMGMALVGAQALWAARLPFLLLHGANSLIAARLALGQGEAMDMGRLAGLFALFPLYYAVFLTLPETFVPTMTLGGLFFLIAFERGAISTFSPLRMLLLGVVCGLMHLTRADGVVWLSGAFVLWAWQVLRARQNLNERHQVVPSLLSLLAGYGVVVAPWIYHNLASFGSVLQPGAGRALWLTNYNDLYAYPASLLTPARWLAQGWQAILKDRLSALGINLINAWAVQGQVFLLPLMVVGLWEKRKRSEVPFLAGMALVNWLIMSLVFPYAGVRGGYIHSGAALQLPLLAFASVGFRRFIAWGSRYRKWDVASARKVLGTGLVGVLYLASAFLFYTRVIGHDFYHPTWLESYERDSAVDRALKQLGYSVDASLGAVNNPPGFFVNTGRQSIAIPGGALSQLISAVCRYGVDYIVLEEEQGNLLDLYRNPSSVAELELLTSVHKTHIFRLANPSHICPSFSQQD